MAKTFQEFINTLKPSNIRPSYYYTDYQVVAKHLEDFREVLNKFPESINSIEEFVDNAKAIYKTNPNIISIIPLFTGVRPDTFTVINDQGKIVPKFNHQSVTFEEAMMFLAKVGFMARIKENAPLNLRSYFFGVNVGLDSNGRKNRGGKQMERLVGSYIKPLTEDWIEQCTFDRLNKKFDTSYTSTNKKDKKFDFGIQRADGKTILIETNFFNSSGSKTDINTRFVSLKNELAKVSEDIIFVVITDGNGLKKAMSEIEDVFTKIEHVYNIDDLEKGILKELINSFHSA